MLTACMESVDQGDATIAVERDATHRDDSPRIGIPVSECEIERHSCLCISVERCPFRPENSQGIQAQCDTRDLQARSRIEWRADTPQEAELLRQRFVD